MSRPSTPVAGRALDVGLHQLVRRGLRGVWLRGALPARSAVWAANHHSWWDGFVASAVLAAEHRPAALVMDGDNLDAYGFLRSIGVVPSGRPREALRSLREGRVLVVFPEGELRAPGDLGPLLPGASWFARHAPAALLPVAVRVTTRAHQYPEAYVDIGPPLGDGSDNDPGSDPGNTPGDDLPTMLAQRLLRLDEVISRADPAQPPAGFRCVVDGRGDWDERIGRLSTKLSTRRSSGRTT